jgi:hypothetical protein
MNKHDSNNLRFIISLKTQEEMEDWMENISEDDMEYALEIVRRAIAELDVELMKAQEEIQDHEGLDCSEALEFINRVKKESL